MTERQKLIVKAALLYAKLHPCEVTYQFGNDIYLYTIEIDGQEDKAISVKEYDELIESGLFDFDYGPKCNCGCSQDPGCCGHSPNCPMKEIEG